MTRNRIAAGILIVGGVAATGVAAYGAAGVIGVARRCSEFAAASEEAAQSARRIGFAYLRVHPEEASEAGLLAAASACIKARTECGPGHSRRFPHHGRRRARRFCSRRDCQMQWMDSR